MSGIKQHYIPQVLLRRFSKFPTKKIAPLWAYTRERGTYQTNSRDLAAERKFYSPLQQGSRTLDDEITDYENRLTELLAAITSTSEGSPVEGLAAAEVVAHLSVRNAHIRDAFQTVGASAIAGVAKLMLDSKYSRHALGLDGSKEGKIQLEIRKRLEDEHPHLTQHNRSVLETKILAKAAETLDAFYAKQLPLVQAALSTADCGLANAAKEGHLNALHSSFVPEKRLSDLAKLQWITSTGKYILPDCAAVALGQSTPIPYLMADWDEIDTVYLPLSSDRVLIGAVTSPAAFESVDINNFSARCSGDFFVAEEQNATWDALVPYIGTVTAQTIEKHMNEALDGLKARQKTTPNTTSE